MKENNTAITKREIIKQGSDEETLMFCELFNEYRAAYQGEWARLEKCDKLYRGTYWDDIPKNSPNEPRPFTPIIQSTVENARAELDGYLPEAIITADFSKYSDTAQLLQNVISENHIACNYEDEYEKMVYDLLVGGYMVQETGFDSTLSGGLGSSYIRHVDNTSIMFDPCAVTVDDCRAIFRFCSHNYSWYKMHYPDKVNQMVFDEYTLKNTGDDVLSPRHDDECLLIECWFRDYDSDTCRHHIHTIKMAGRVKLEDSRDLFPNGIYSHGKYPFTVTKLYTRKGSCLGYGYCDMFERQQQFSDKIDQIILKNALMSSHNKLLVSSGSGFDINDLRDWSKEVHHGENINGIKWFSTAPLPSYIMDYAQNIRSTMKEESGSSEFSRGITTGGVTAASAINALIEASSKRSRTIARKIHSAFAENVRMEIENERQFGIFKRHFMTDNREMMFDNSMLYDNGMPIEFIVSVKVQKKTKFEINAQNETVIKLVELGMITPDVGLELLNFEGKQEAVEKMKMKGDTGGGQQV